MPAQGFVGDPVSAWGEPNVLLQTLSGAQTATVRHNQLLNSGAEMEVLARASGAILSLPEDQRAAAYQQQRADLQRQGYAQNAPEAYPGEAVLRRLQMMGVPAEKQAEWGYNLAGNKALLGDRTGATTTATMPSVTTTQPAPSGSGYAPTGAPLTPYVAPNLPQGVTAAEDQAVRTVIGEAGAEPLIGQAAVAHVINNRAKQSGGDVTSVVFAPNQFEPWNNPTTRAKLEAIDPNSAQYQHILNNVVRPALSGQSQDPTGGATHFYSPTAQQQLGREAPSWAANQTPAVIGRHNFYNIGYRAPGGGTTQAQTTAAANTGPVILGDSLASPQGLGGTGVVGAKPATGENNVLSQVQTAAKNGALRGRDVVISSGASNAPSEVSRVEDQIKAAKDGGAKSVTVVGVGTRPDIVGSNGVLQQLAEKNGARFVPVDPATLSGDQVHPENYAPLKQAIAGSPAAPGGVAGRTGGVNVAGPPMAPAGSTGGAAAMPHAQAVAAAASSGQPVPIANPDGSNSGLVALPGGGVRNVAVPQPPPNALAPGQQGNPPAPGAVQPPATTQPPAQPQRQAPQPPRLLQLDGDNLTAQNRKDLEALGRIPGTKTADLQQRMLAIGQQNVAHNEKAEAAYRAEQQFFETQQQHAIDNRYKELQYQQSLVKNEQEAGRYKMAQAEFDQKMVAANRRYPGDSQDAADMNLLLDGANGKADISTPDFANAYVRQKYQKGQDGSTIERDMSMFPTPTRAVQPPTVTAGQGAQFERANKLRDEFQTLTKDFRTVQTAYENIVKAGDSKTGPGDMAMLYAFLHMIDPQTGIKESEYGGAAAAGSLRERINGALSRVTTGERLDDSLRDSFLHEADSLYSTQLAGHNSIADQYTALSESMGVNPKNVVTRFDHPQAPRKPVGDVKVIVQ